LSEAPQNPSEWESILKLATKWAFPSIRALAIKRLGVMDALSKLTLGRQYNVPDWVIGGYNHLCTRTLPPDLAEGRILGLEDIIRIGQVRHELSILRSGALAADGDSDGSWAAQLVSATFKCDETTSSGDHPTTAEVTSEHLTEADLASDFDVVLTVPQPVLEHVAEVTSQSDNVGCELLSEGIERSVARASSTLKPVQTSRLNI
jgi:hypothetical protein